LSGDYLLRTLDPVRGKRKRKEAKKRERKGGGRIVLGSTVDEKRARALLRYFTCRMAVEMRMNKRRYEIGNVKTRYNDRDNKDETPFVDNAVNPPKTLISASTRRLYHGEILQVSETFWVGGCSTEYGYEAQIDSYGFLAHATGKVSEDNSYGTARRKVNQKWNLRNSLPNILGRELSR
jgi:hypothetical protein